SKRHHRYLDRDLRFGASILFLWCISRNSRLHPDKTSTRGTNIACDGDAGSADVGYGQLRSAWGEWPSDKINDGEADQLASTTAAPGNSELLAQRKCLRGNCVSCGGWVSGPAPGGDFASGRGRRQAAHDHNVRGYRRACEPRPAHAERNGGAPLDRARECGTGAGQSGVTCRRLPSGSTFLPLPRTATMWSRPAAARFSRRRSGRNAQVFSTSRRARWGRVVQPKIARERRLARLRFSASAGGGHSIFPTGASKIPGRTGSR